MVRRAAIKVAFPPTEVTFVALPVNDIRTLHVMLSALRDHVLGGTTILALCLPMAFSEGNSANFGDIWCSHPARQRLFIFYVNKTYLFC